MPTPPVTFSLRGDGLPEDAITTRFKAVEAISEPYEVNVEIATRDTSYVIEPCLRKHMCLVVKGHLGDVRLFDGIVDQARFVRMTARFRVFELRLVPALAALAHREGCRIFQDKSTVQVVQTLFQEAGFGDKVEWCTKKEYEAREFVVQYRESHLNFVSRLLEDEGMFYFFRHTEDGHEMVVADDSAAFAVESGQKGVVFSLSQGGAQAGSETLGEPLERFSRRRSLRTTTVKMVDFDFEKPQQQPETTVPSEDALPLHFFEYPGGFLKAAAGQRRGDARMRELRADADTCDGTSRAIGLRVGSPFAVDSAAEDCLNGEFVVTRLVTEGVDKFMEEGASNSTAHNVFRGIPVGAPYAAARRAKRPRIHGVQTATVTGSSTQEQAIHVDEYGRVKVRFHWDREGQWDHTSSCWLRVAQVAMGGSMILPRVGWELSVAFLEGDPDRPLALGRVYNAEKVPPYSLPASKASGSLKSHSSPGGAGHNELNMGDSAGSQGLTLHAEKDLNVTVGNDKTEEITANETHEITCNASHTVKVNETVDVTGDQSLEVGDVLSHDITGNQTLTVGGADVSNAISNFVEKITGDRSYTVKGNKITISNGIEHSIKGDFTRKVGALQLVGTIGSINDNVIGALTEDSGALKVQLVNGNHGETITGSKNQTSVAAELHMTKASLAASAAGSVTTLVGGLHYQKLDGDYVVQAPLITLLGAVGVFKGGGSELKLGGGPVTLKGDAIAIESALVVKMSTSMKLGS